MFKSLILIQLLMIFTIGRSNAFWGSLVNIDRSDTGVKKVGVHLPFIYWMDLNRNKLGPKLDISVLSGLVKVNVDRKQDLDKPPVMVRLLGAKIYNSYPKNYDSNAENKAYQAAETKEDENIAYVKPKDDHKQEDYKNEDDYKKDDHKNDDYKKDDHKKDDYKNGTDTSVDIEPKSDSVSVESTSD